MITKDQSYITSMILLAIITLGGVGYQIFDTGEELVCRTNKPVGWDITFDYGSFVEAVCPYKTKEPITVYCKPSFRSTASYKNYGCSEVVLIEDVPIDIPKDYIPSKGKYECKHNGCVEV